MNILYVSSKKNWGGVASWMVRTAQGLEAKGHKVWILSARHSLFAQKAPGTLKLVLWTFGFDYNPLSILYAAYLIKRHKIDLVVTNIEKEITVGGIAAKLCGIPNIRRVGSHNDFNDKKPKIRFRHERFVTASIAPCDAIWTEAVTHSPWLKNYPFTTIYNGRNPQLFTPGEIDAQRAAWGCGKQTVVIGTTTRLAREKRVDIVLNAFAKALPGLPAPSLLIISGTGKDESMLRALCSELRIEENVLFAGFTQTPLLAAAAYDIALAVADYEGFPNTVVEYMSVGTPVISTDVGGVDEIIIHNENGLLIAPGDEAALTEKMVLLANNAALRKQMGEAAQKRVAESFSESAMIDQLEAYFKKQVKKAP